MCSADCFLSLLAILFPPLPVWVKTGICSADSIINLLLCVLGYIPGLIHAWYIIAKYPEPDYDYQGATDAEGGRVYVFVHDNRPHGQGQQQQRPGQPHQVLPKPYAQPQSHGVMNYGTAAGSSTSPAPPPQNHTGGDAGEGPSDGPPPPSYAQVVAGDHKVQTRE